MIKPHATHEAAAAGRVVMPLEDTHSTVEKEEMVATDQYVHHAHYPWIYGSLQLTCIASISCRLEDPIDNDGMVRLS